MNHDIFMLVFMSIWGAAASMCYDILRALRRAVKHSMAAIWITDFLYWCMAAVMTAYWILVFNDGKLRVWIFCALIIGVILYFFTVSRWILALFSAIFENILKIFRFIFKILLTPVQFLYKILIEKKSGRIARQNEEGSKTE